MAHFLVGQCLSFVTSRYVALIGDRARSRFFCTIYFFPGLWGVSSRDQRFASQGMMISPDFPFSSWVVVWGKAATMVDEIPLSLLLLCKCFFKMLICSTCGHHQYNILSQGKDLYYWKVRIVFPSLNVAPRNQPGHKGYASVSLLSDFMPGVYWCLHWDDKGKTFHNP